MSNVSWPAEQPGLLHHGGRLRIAARRYAIPLSQWLDLSTGINPDGWRPPAPPASVWMHLPEDEDGLEEAARDYYGVDELLPAAGSQAAIQALPRLRPACRVCVLHPGYAEHAHAWRGAGHDVAPVGTEQLDHAAKNADVLVLSNPNNPTGEHFSPDRLLAWNEQLERRGGWLVVDEAFMDATPGQSIVGHCPRPGLIGLRSLGKFFGLAGARVGFVCADAGILASLRAALGPWTVSAPARWVAAQALADRAWQARARGRLGDDGERLRALLIDHGLVPAGGCALFQWVPTARAEVVHVALARRGILTRLFDEPPGLRFGLPGGEADWRRLDEALTSVLAESRETGS